MKVDYPPAWLTWVASATGCLNALGVDCDHADVAGFTGMAFLMTVHETLCPSGPTVRVSELPLRGIACLGRSHLVYTGDEGDPDASGLFLAVNTNKRSLVVDPAGPDASDRVASLVAETDVVVTNLTQARLAEIGFDPAQARSDRPELVVCSISPFGLTGPRAEGPAWRQLPPILPDPVPTHGSLLTLDLHAVDRNGSIHSLSNVGLTPDHPAMLFVGNSGQPVQDDFKRPGCFSGAHHVDIQ